MKQLSQVPYCRSGTGGSCHRYGRFVVNDTDNIFNSNSFTILYVIIPVVITGEEKPAKSAAEPRRGATQESEHYESLKAPAAAGTTASAAAVTAAPVAYLLVRAIYLYKLLD